MDDAVYLAGTRSQPFGDSKAGLSSDLDALAAYVRSLTNEPPSPYPRGASSERGKVLFESAATRCTECHSGSRFTDSGVGGLHDVGTIGPASGSRLGAKLEGLDTPTLAGAWRTAPYLHDGSAATLRDVLTTKNADDRHGVTSALSSSEIDDLIAYLLTLD